MSKSLTNEDIIKKYELLPDLKKDNPDSWLYALGVFMFTTIGFATIFFALHSIIIGVTK